MHGEELTLINQCQYVLVLSMFHLPTSHAVSLTDNFEKAKKENKNSPYLHTKVKLIMLRTKCEEQIPS